MINLQYITYLAVEWSFLSPRVWRKYFLLSGLQSIYEAYVQVHRGQNFFTVELTISMCFFYTWQKSSLGKKQNKKVVVQRTLKHEDKTHSCISKHFKTFISGTPEPHALGSTKSGLDKEYFIKSLLMLFFFFLFVFEVCGKRGRWGEKTRQNRKPSVADYKRKQ